jgi:DNA primase
VLVYAPVLGRTRIPDAFLDEQRAKLPMFEVVGMYEWKVLSPFRTKKTASFFVNGQKPFFYDFGSGEHRDIFEFVRRMENLTFAEAVERSAVMAGRSAVPSPTSTPASAKLVNNRGWESIWNSAPVVGSNAARAPLKKTPLEGAGCRQFVQNHVCRSSLS